MSTRCFENNLEYKCLVRVTDTTLVLEKQEIVGETRKIPLSQIKVLERSDDVKLKITTAEEVAIELIINELVKKDVERFIFLYKFVKEQQDVMGTVEKILHSYVLLLSPVFRIVIALTKGNVPKWESLREAVDRLQDFARSVDFVTDLKDLRKSIAEYVKALSSSVDSRDVTVLLSVARNYVKYITTYFSNLLRRAPIYVNLSHMIDLTLIAFIHFYSKNLGLPLQAERARSEFKHLTQELVSETLINDEIFKDRVVTSFELVLGTSRSPEEVPQTLLSILQEEIARYISRSA